MAWDSTGQEGVYAWAKYFNDTTTATNVINSILATNRLSLTGATMATLVVIGTMFMEGNFNALNVNSTIMVAVSTLYHSFPSSPPIQPIITSCVSDLQDFLVQ